ncbi:MAG: transposase [Pirellulales bacterium]
MLWEAIQKIELIDAIKNGLPDPRDPTYIIHEQREKLAQQVVSLALGYEDLNDQQLLRTGIGSLACRYRKKQHIELNFPKSIARMCIIRLRGWGDVTRCDGSREKSQHIKLTPPQTTDLHGFF